MICVSWWHASMVSTYIDRATQQRASLQGFANYPVEIFGSLAELVHLRHTTCEVLKAFSGAPSGQSLIRAVQPDTTLEKPHLPSTAAL